MPARAPRPGAGKRIEIDQQIQQELDTGFEIYCGVEDRAVVVLFGDLDSDDELVCLRETGFAPQNLMNQTMDHTGILVFYWLGVRKLKDPPALKKILSQYGTPRKFMEAGVEAWGRGLFAGDDESGDEDEEGTAAVDPTQCADPSGPPGRPGPASMDSAPRTSAAPQF